MPLFKLTERGSLTPSGAETLTKRVGEARDDGALIVPQVNARTLGRYQAVGRVCGLALVNRVTLGLPFARYFLCLVMGEAPTELPALQRELAEEDPSLLSEAVFLSQASYSLQPHTSHLTLTPHTHLTPHTLHLTPHNSHLTPHVLHL